MVHSSHSLIVVVYSCGPPFVSCDHPLASGPNPLVREGDKVRIQFDADPVTAVLFGDEANGPSIEERIENRSGSSSLVTLAGRAQMAEYRKFADKASGIACPWLAATNTDSLRHAREQWPLDQRFREGGEVRPFEIC